MKLAKLLDVLRELAPESLAESWDQVGLHVGVSTRQVGRALLCIDLTWAVLEEAIAKRCQLIVAYHPPIFTPLDRLTDAKDKERLILTAAERKIALYSPHTALDAAREGVNDWLVQAAGPGCFVPITPGAEQSLLRKVVVFVPVDAADRVSQAMTQAGAGQQGDYSDCVYETQGIGQFRPNDRANPALGQAGQLQRVTEKRLEMLVAEDKLTGVMRAMRQTHPYEEPAFDILPRQGEPMGQAPGVGAGRVGDLDQPIALKTLITRIKKHLGVKHLEVAPASGQRTIRRLAVCPGAGGSLLPKAGAVDAYLTGEMRHHDVLAAVQSGTTVILAGHTQTERPYLKVYRQRLRQAVGGAVDWHLSRADRPPSAQV